MIDPKTIMYEEGRRDALDLASRAPQMDGTSIIAEEDHIPAWSSKTDYSGQPKNTPVRDEGQVWLLLIPHRAADYGGRPETLRSLWGLAHTTDPHKAKPWMPSYGVSGLYKVDECCTYYTADGSIHVFRNLYDNNEYPPLTLNVEHRWEDLGEVSAWQ
jgi:hypothetical protein